MMFLNIINILNLFILLNFINSIESHYNQPAYQPQQQPGQQGHLYNEPMYGQPQQMPQQQQQQQQQQPQGGYQVNQQAPNQQMAPQMQQPHGHGHEQGHGVNVLHDKERIRDREHLKEHLGGVLSEPDLSKLSDEELQFYYFKMHDSDNNEKLDGSELIKSLIHWHVEESKHLGANAPASGTTKLFTDVELAQMIDPILEMDDKNMDGFIDYPEFIAAQKNRRF